MKVHVDTDQCRGHGVCWGLCPEVFDISNGYAEVLVDDVPTQFEQAVLTAVEQCPERAITTS